MTPSRRRTESLDGDGWQIRSHLGLDAALSAAARGSRTPSANASAAPGDVHAVHTTADAAAGWLPARVPGSVVDDLMHAGEIEDVYRDRNSRAAEWVAQRAWTYRRTIDLPGLADGERAWLQFDGIDQDAVHGNRRRCLAQVHRAGVRRVSRERDVVPALDRDRDQPG